MDKGNNDELRRICRLCSREDKYGIDIFGDQGRKHNLEKKIRLCLPISVQETDIYPKMMCLNCLNKLDTSYELYSGCIKAQATIKKLYEASKQEDPFSNKRSFLDSGIINGKDVSIKFGSTIIKLQEFLHGKNSEPPFKQIKSEPVSPAADPELVEMVEDEAPAVNVTKEHPAIIGSSTVPTLTNMLQHIPSNTTTIQKPMGQKLPHKEIINEVPMLKFIKPKPIESMIQKPTIAEVSSECTDDKGSSDASSLNQSAQVVITQLHAGNQQTTVNAHLQNITYNKTVQQSNSSLERTNTMRVNIDGIEKASSQQGRNSPNTNTVNNLYSQTIVPSPIVMKQNIPTSCIVTVNSGQNPTVAANIPDSSQLYNVVIPVSMTASNTSVTSSNSYQVSSVSSSKHLPNITITNKNNIPISSYALTQVQQHLPSQSESNRQSSNISANVSGSFPSYLPNVTIVPRQPNQASVPHSSSQIRLKTFTGTDLSHGNQVTVPQDSILLRNLMHKSETAVQTVYKTVTLNEKGKPLSPSFKDNTVTVFSNSSPSQTVFTNVKDNTSPIITNMASGVNPNMLPHLTSDTLIPVIFMPQQSINSEIKQNKSGAATNNGGSNRKQDLRESNSTNQNSSDTPSQNYPLNTLKVKTTASDTSATITNNANSSENIGNTVLCNYCNKLFSVDIIAHHKALHFRETVFSCIDCNKNFYTEKGLESHRCCNSSNDEVGSSKKF